MKKKNKLLALLLAATMSFSVSACGSADTGKKDDGKSTTENTDSNDSKDIDYYASAVEKMKNVSSLNCKMVIDMEMKITAGDESQTMKSSTVSNMSCFYDPLKVKADMTVDTGEAGKTDLSVYAEAAEDGNYTMYMYDGTNWMSQTVTMEDLSAYDAAGNMTDYLQDSYNFQDAGTEKINGKDARKYTGAMTGDDMREAITSTGALNSLSSLGIDESQVESMFKDLGDLPITMWIDEEECYPVKYELDMSSLMNALMANIMESMGEEAAGASIEFTQMHTEMNFSDLNAVEEFTIPDEAKAAAPAA